MRSAGRFVDALTAMLVNYSCRKLIRQMQRGGLLSGHWLVQHVHGWVQLAALAEGRGFLFHIDQMMPQPVLNTKCWHTCACADGGASHVRTEDSVAECKLESVCLHPNGISVSTPEWNGCKLQHYYSKDATTDAATIIRTQSCKIHGCEHQPQLLSTAQFDNKTYEADVGDRGQVAQPPSGATSILFICRLSRRILNISSSTLCV